MNAWIVLFASRMVVAFGQERQEIQQEMARHGQEGQGLKRIKATSLTSVHQQLINKAG
jgi:hypothetical protein